MKIKRFVLMFAFLAFAIAIPIWASVVENDPEAIVLVNVIGTPEGLTIITIPGHDGYEVESFSLDYDMEFYITPPSGTYFSPETALVTFGNIEISFGPVVRGCGRLFFIALPLSLGSPGHPGGTTYFSINFRPAGGVMPAGETLTRSVPINTMLTELPVPIREGHQFGSWMIGTQLVSLPVLVTSDLDLSAVWVRADNFSNESNNPGSTQTVTPLATTGQSTTSDTYAVAFNPGYGSFASGETGIRVGAYGTQINNIPTPTRNGYIFGGWLMPNGELLSGNMYIRGDATLLALWNVDPEAAPSPSPSPTTGSGTGARPNPQTSPMQISLMIFGTMIIAAISALSILKLNRKQAAAAGKYRQEAARYRLEKRIMDFLEE